MAESSVEAVAPLHPSGGRQPDGRYDDVVTDQPPDDPRAGQSPVPGERRLAHPPSDRYRVAAPQAAEAEPEGSVARGLALAVALAAVGALAIIVLGGVLAISAGLIVAAAAIGWAVGLGLRAGARGSLSRTSRIRLALALAIASIALGQLGLWLYARTEGGVLGPLDYLGETFGLLVPLEVLAASIAAWVSAR